MVVPVTIHPCSASPNLRACLPARPPAHPNLQRPRVEVIRSGIEPVVPKVGDVITARVVRINPRLAAGAWLGGWLAGWESGWGSSSCLGLRQWRARWDSGGRMVPPPPPPHPVCTACPPAVDILCVGPKPVRQRYSGVIRVQDVRATEIDKVGA